MLLSPMTPSAFQPILPPLDSSYVDPLQNHMPASKRPKLSLQTTLPTAPAGVSSSQTGSSRVDNAATPTTRNTLVNQYHTFDLSIRPSPASTTASPAAFPKPASLSRQKRSLPYDLNLPIGGRSILKNSTIPSDVRRGSLGAASASPRSATGGRRAFFPEPKRVKFGAEEEIVTSTYVARHVDLSSSSEDESGSSGSDSDSLGGKETVKRDAEGVTATKPPGRSGEAVIVDEVQRSGGTSHSSGRRSRKRRRWEWTLGESEDQQFRSVEGAEKETTASEEQTSPSIASTSSSPSVTTPCLDNAEAKEPQIAVQEVVPTPTSATADVEQSPPSPVV